MKTSRSLKLLVAAMMLGLASIPNFVYGGLIKVTSSGSGDNNGNDNTQSHFPRRHPAHYTDLAVAYWETGTGVLSIGFNAESEEVSISIYKDDTLVVESTRSVNNGTEVSFNLSSYDSGDYQIVIMGICDDDLYGNFIFK